MIKNCIIRIWEFYRDGFQGINMDSRFQNNFFAKDQIVYHIGVQDSIVKLYEQAIYHYYWK